MDITALYNISYGLYVVGSKIDGKDAGSVVDAFIQSTSSPVPTVILCSIQANQTNAAIKQTGEFTVSVLANDVDPFIIGNFGFQSGRDADKWANVKHKRIGDLPVLENAVAYLRCKVIDHKELSTHTAFFCEVIDAVKGQGEPLIYGEYQKNMKAKTMEAFKEFKNNGKAPAPVAEKSSRWVCTVCGYVYDGEVPFEQLPADWKCPICGQPKSVFVIEKAEENKTTKNLMEAFAGESQANRKYMTYAKKAEAEGKKNAAKLFSAASDAETIHALKEFEIAGKINSTSDNLLDAVKGETHEYQDIYPEFIKTAEAEGNKAAAMIFTYAMKAEEAHAKLYKEALDSINNDEEIFYYLCPVCGNIEKFIPERCSICGIPGSKFIKY